MKDGQKSVMTEGAEQDTSLKERRNNVYMFKVSIFVSLVVAFTAVILAIVGLALHDDHTKNTPPPTAQAEFGFISSTMKAIEGSTVFAGLSVAMGIDGLPMAAFISADSKGTAVFLKCLDANCATHTTLDLHEVYPTIAVSSRTFLFTGSDGLPVVVFGQAPVRVAHCEDVSCSKWSVFDTSINSVDGEYTALMSTEGELLLAWGEDESNVFLLRCKSVTCDDSETNPFTTYEYHLFFSGIRLVMGVDGNPLVAFNSAGDVSEPHSHAFRLHLFHCLDAHCGTFEELTEPAPSSPFANVTEAVVSLTGDGRPLLFIERDHLLSVVNCNRGGSGSCTNDPIPLSPVFEFRRTGFYHSFVADGLTTVLYNEEIDNTRKLMFFIHDGVHFVVQPKLLNPELETAFPAGLSSFGTLKGPGHATNLMALSPKGIVFRRYTNHFWQPY